MSGPATGRPARIGDVARVAGVSVPTVSRVLTGAAKVSPERRRRVLEAIEELSYRPNAAARALVTGRADIIAVMTSETSNHGYSMTLRGIETAARAAGFHVVISVVDSPARAEVSRAVDLVLGHALAGVIVLKFDPTGVEAVAALPDDVPVVQVSGEVDGRRPQAVLDEEAGGHDITAYLLGLGHRTVHHVSVPPSRAEDGRTTGWRRALTDARAPVPDILPATFAAASGVPIGWQISTMPEVTAVFCGNDEVAMGVVSGLADAGLAVPGDMSVVGFDDHPLATIWRPALTTVAQDFERLGERAFDLLAARMAGGTEATLSSERPELQVRHSAGPPAVRKGVRRAPARRAAARA